MSCKTSWLSEPENLLLLFCHSSLLYPVAGPRQMGFLSNEFLRNGVNSYRPLSFSSSLHSTGSSNAQFATCTFVARAPRCRCGNGTSPPCVVVQGNDYYLVTIVIQLWVFEDIDQAKMISIQCHIGAAGPTTTCERQRCILHRLANYVNCGGKVTCWK